MASGAIFLRLNSFATDGQTLVIGHVLLNDHVIVNEDEGDVTVEVKVFQNFTGDVNRNEFSP